MLSKRIKDFDLKERIFVVQWLFEHIFWPIENIFHRYKERIMRSFAFARLGWLNYDFDGGYIWEILSFKLKRIHKCLLNGHAVQEDEDMNALLEAIAICERLKEDTYEDKYSAIYDAKYGALEMNESTDSTRFSDLFVRKHVTPENAEQAHKELMEYYKQGELDRLADLDRLNEILKNHLQAWWD